MGRIGFNNEFDVLDNYKLSHVQSGITTDRRELNEVKCRLAGIEVVRPKYFD